jgi:hypothetical protein
MENSCLADILILSAILFFCSNILSSFVFNENPQKVMKFNLEKQFQSLLTMNQ